MLTTPVNMSKGEAEDCILGTLVDDMPIDILETIEGLPIWALIETVNAICANGTSPIDMDTRIFDAEVKVSQVAKAGDMDPAKIYTEEYPDPTYPERPLYGLVIDQLTLMLDSDLESGPVVVEKDNGLIKAGMVDTILDEHDANVNLSGITLSGRSNEIAPQTDPESANAIREVAAASAALAAMSSENVHIIDAWDRMRTAVARVSSAAAKLDRRH
jgi:hypothetical protein